VEENLRVGEIMRERIEEFWGTGWYGQSDPSLVQVKYRVTRTEKTEPCSSELPGDMDSDN
jgi:hypothetical protein